LVSFFNDRELIRRFLFENKLSRATEGEDPLDVVGIFDTDARRHFVEDFDVVSALSDVFPF
jgi:hypothetical protein